MEPKMFERVDILNITLYMEAFILLTATLWMFLGNIPLKQSLVSPTGPQILIGLLAGVSLPLVSILWFYLGKFVGVLQQLRDIIIQRIAPLFCTLSFWDLLLVASVSGFCEEVFFRGVLQHQIGLWQASLVFGVFHCPSVKHLSYGLWACLAGCLLGVLYLSTSSLWPPILAHSLSNWLSLMFCRWRINTQNHPPDNMGSKS